MQNLGSIYNDVLYRSGKDKIGGYISIDDFNVGLPVVNVLYETYYVNLFEETKQISSDLRTLIKTRGNNQNPPILLDSSGHGEIPEDYRYHARSSYTQWTNDQCGVQSDYRQVLFVSQAEFDNRMRTRLYRPTLTQPLVLFEGNQLLVRPIMPKFSMTYIKQAATPYFDYDIISGIPIYLPPGEHHLNSTVEPVGTLSQSVEFEYPQESYPKLATILTAYFAIGNRADFNLATVASLLQASAT